MVILRGEICVLTDVEMFQPVHLNVLKTPNKIAPKTTCGQAAARLRPRARAHRRQKAAWPRPLFGHIAQCTCAHAWVCVAASGVVSATNKTKMPNPAKIIERKA